MYCEQESTPLYNPQEGLVVLGEAGLVEVEVEWHLYMVSRNKKTRNYANHPEHRLRTIKNSVCNMLNVM